MTDSPVQPLPPLDPAMDASQNHYWTYHGLDTLLACKRPLTASQDEDLFIAVHQVCEIAFHQMILDLDRAIDSFAAGLASGDPVIGPEADEAAYFLRRVNGLWGTVNATMPVLAGMRAFAEFRTSIGPTSGFQSFQFRRLEVMAGVEAAYWNGGTKNAAGELHPAETNFDAVHGPAVETWFGRYRDRNLARLTASLCERAPLETLDDHPRAGPLIRALAEFDRAKVDFHRRHLGLATVQLRKVGVSIGTGGTDFRTYLAKYEQTLAPLFPSLVASD